MAMAQPSLAAQHSLPRVGVPGLSRLPSDASPSRASTSCPGMPRCGGTQLSRLSWAERAKHREVQEYGFGAEVKRIQWNEHSALGVRRQSRNVSAAAVGYAEGVEFVRIVNDWSPSEESIKTLYLIIACFFSWGCCVFGSMKDPFYDSDGYRGDGGNGTQYWIYDRQEVAEEKAREALWREELLQEIEGKIGELGELAEPEELGKLQLEEEKVKELV